MQAIEMVRFTVKAGRESALVDGRATMVAALSAAYPSLVVARLARVDEATWLDLVVWESREEALAAAEGAFGVADCAAWFDHIDQVLSMEHADVVAVAHGREDGSAVGR